MNTVNFLGIPEGDQALAQITIYLALAPKSDAAYQALNRANLVKLRQGAAYLVELGFDGKSQGKKANFRPSLPLVFHW